MKVRKSRNAILGVVFTSAAAVPAVGVPIQLDWDHSCPCGERDEGTNPDWDCGMFMCSCEGTWNDVTYWVQGAYPQSSSQTATIEHSNHGCCSNDCACSENSDCTGNCSSDCSGAGQEEEEDVLMIFISTETILRLEVVTASTPATTEKLKVAFKPNAGTRTLTAATMLFDATNGDLTVTVSGNATLKTN